ncbi:hypothetical protein GM708_00865 [Vibrio cholerae]|nr:hypothetical protein [Vibrio cholerae]
MATAYHRRPRPSGLDIAAVAHNKIGSGSAWQGYYMYTGGTNPSGRDHSYTTGLQESQETGYPNDLPQYDYDFHAPIGSSGRLNASHSLLRRQHAFLDAFGASLGPMESHLPSGGPAGIDDATTLRWAIRSDGNSAFLFITWHQPYVPLRAYEGARFQVTLGDKRMLLPREPVTVPSGTLAHWPLGLVIDGVELEWATASPLTTLHDETGTVLVLAAEHGIPLTWQWAEDVIVTPGEDGGGDASTGPGPFARVQAYRCSTATTHLDVVVLPAAEADRAWVLGNGSNRQLVLSDHPVWLEVDGLLNGRATAPEADVRRYQPATRAFVPVLTRSLDTPPSRQRIPVSLLRPAGVVPASYGGSGGRASAPTQEAVQNLAAAYELDVPRDQGAGRRELEIDWTGDIAQLMVDDEVVADRFWDGSPWIVDLDTLGAGPGTTLVMNLLPLTTDHPIHLPEEARRSVQQGRQHVAPCVELVTWRQWTECPDSGA